MIKILPPGFILLPELKPNKELKMKHRAESADITPNLLLPAALLLGFNVHQDKNLYLIRLDYF
ncbi:hypothetical protein [Pinibacter soli]|uniref:Uncharacterized protein n=1 Tax=Pinibacter soli TaxID=3044211 RepID=A0ABT6R9N8_9BACT|nr:hypothetical protein [Pinibacter soli]MDI3319271.1 hypothetical protein [Pinibacter soli]